MECINQRTTLLGILALVFFILFLVFGAYSSELDRQLKQFKQDALAVGCAKYEADKNGKPVLVFIKKEKTNE